MIIVRLFVVFIVALVCYILWYDMTDEYKSKNYNAAIIDLIMIIALIFVEINTLQQFYNG